MRQLIFLLMFVPIAAFADTPSTSCPSGYVAINEKYVTIATECRTGVFVSVGTAESCLGTNPSGNCIMYVPAGVSYTDNSGKYEFTEACPLQ